MDIISLTLADKHLSSNGIPRLEFKIALGQKVTGITVLHSIDAGFHIRDQRIIFCLRFLYILFQRHDLENGAFHFAAVWRYRPRHIIDAAAVIEKALQDYKAALITKNKDGIKEAERFLRSQWFEVLADDLNGETLITTMKEAFV